jgi:rare lipoprotein A
MGMLLLLASCAREKGPERLLPPEPVLIKGDVVTTGTKEEAAAPPLTEEEVQRPLPTWAQTKGDGVYKLGKPYKVNGVWYFPAENPRYDEIGFASRYPKSFQGQRTANGEIYNNEMLTACHKTLPLPSIVQVTNLSNNKSIIVRINDRGPFVNDRLIDVSEKAATLLEFPEEGNVKVRIEIMNQESKTAANALQGAEKAVIPASAVTKEAEEPSLEKSENFVNVEPTPSSPEEAEAESLFDPPPAQQTLPPQPAPASSPQEKMAPVEHVSPPEKHYYVQAGVFGNPENAKNLSDKLGSVGLVESTPLTVNGRSLHRVRVGPFSSITDAQHALQKIKRYNLPDARIMIS